MRTAIILGGVVGLTLCVFAQTRPFGRPQARGPRSMGLVQESTPQPASDYEARILDVISTLETQRMGMMNVPLRDGRLLRILVEAIGARQVVEIGTSNGYSGLWLCLGLKATGGRLTTFEIDPVRASLARDNFTKAGVDSLVQIVQGDAHQKVKGLSGPIDLVFIDADKEGYLDYLQRLLPLVRPAGMADPGFVRAITNDPNLETVFLPQDTSGVAITLKKRGAEAKDGTVSR